MQLDNYSLPLASSINRNFICREVEVAIRSGLAVDDCVVIQRQTKKLKQELVAYIVPSGSFIPEQLLSDLQKILPSEYIPKAIAPVSTIPLTDKGELDKATLATLELIDSDLVLNIEEQLESLSEIERQKWDLSSMKFIINAGEPIVTNSEALLPKALVPVSGIPLTATGEVDELALMNIPAIDESLIGQVEKQLNSNDKIEQAVVVVQELRKEIPSLHLSDLIPNWQDKSAIANITPIPRDSPTDTQQQFLEPKPLAISHGDILRSDRNAPITLPEVLQKAAQQVASGEIIYLLPDGTELHQSYAELLEVAERILSGLRKLGLKPKNKVILQIELSCDIIPAFWGCLLGGFVPVIMEVPPTYRESNKVVDKLCHIWQFLDSPVILTTEALKQEVELLSQWLPTERLYLGTIEALKDNTASKQYHQSQPDDVALFNLTSGSTGIPKCVQLTHQNLIARARGANQLNQHEPGDVILNWLPFDHIGSISDWHIRGVEIGCTLVYAQKEYILGRILNWLDLIHKYRITHSWAPNFAYAIVNDSLKQEPKQNWNLSCVKFLLTAGEAVSSKAVEDFRENLVVYGLKATAIRPAFGMAEMGSGITYYQPIQEAPLLFHKVDKSIFQGTIKRVKIGYPNYHTFTDLGTVIPGITIRIVDEQNSILREDTIGHLQVKGDITTTTMPIVNPF
jgi:acyl-CoA synthetase (AMP-forming)/AMP-acid ligase II